MFLMLFASVMFTESGVVCCCSLLSVVNSFCCMSYVWFGPSVAFMPCSCLIVASVVYLVSLQEPQGLLKYPYMKYVGSPYSEPQGC